MDKIFVSAVELNKLTAAGLTGRGFEGYDSEKSSDFG
jgi:hypothetical protein